MFAWKNLPAKGLIFLKVASLREIAMCALRTIKGTEGQILVTTTDDDITLSLVGGAGAAITAAANDGDYGVGVLITPPSVDPDSGKLTLHAYKLKGAGGTTVALVDGAIEIKGSGAAIPEVNGNYVINITDGVMTYRRMTLADDVIGICDGDPVPVSKVTIEDA